MAGIQLNHNPTGRSIPLSTPKRSGVVLNQAPQRQLTVYDPSDWEEELKRRKKLALQQGWDPAEVERSAIAERAVRRTQVAQTDYQKRKEESKPKERTALDTVLDFVPFGTIGKKLATGEQVGAGEVALETALTLVPFGLGRVGKAVKGVAGAVNAAQDANKVSRAAGATKESLSMRALARRAGKVGGETGEEAADQSLKSKLVSQFTPQPGAIASRVEDAGQHVRGRARGIVTGAKPQGAAERLMPSDAKAQNEILDAIGAKGSAKRQLGKVEQAQKTSGNAIRMAIDEGNQAVDAKAVTDIGKRVSDRILGTNGSGIAGFNPRLDQEKVDVLMEQLKSIKDVKGLETFRKSLDEVVNYSRNPNSPDPMREKIASAFRKEIDQVVTELVPNSKSYKKLYAGLESAKDTLINSADPKGIAPFGTTVNSRGIGGGVLQAGEDLVGRTVQNAARFSSIPVVKGTAAQAGVRGVANAFGRNEMAAPGAAPEEPLPADIAALFTSGQPVDDQQLADALASNGMSFDDIAAALTDKEGFANSFLAPTPDAAMAGQEQAPALAASSTDLMNTAIQAQMAGDNKTAKQYMDLAKQAAALEKAMGSGGTKFSAAQQKTLMGTSTAGKLVDQIEREVSQIPAGLIGGGLTSLAGKLKPEGGAGAAAEAYNQSRGSRALMLIKAIQGSAGQISDADRTAIQNAVPLATDSQDIRRRKLQSLRDIIESYNQGALTAPSAEFGSFEDLAESMNSVY